MQVVRFATMVLTLIAYGLYDVAGNVFEWVQDRWHDDYTGAPKGGTAWTKGGDPSERIMRGGSWDTDQSFLRASNRRGRVTIYRADNTGFPCVRANAPSS